MATPRKTTFDDLQLGETLLCPPFSFTEEQIIEFCQTYDPQFFHTDPIAAQNSHFGSLIASGWQTSAMVLNVLNRTHFNFGHGIVGLGVDGMRWLAPVRAGDRMTVSTIIKEKRLSASKPGWGICVLAIAAENHHGQTVLRLDTSILIRL